MEITHITSDPMSGKLGTLFEDDDDNFTFFVPSLISSSIPSVCQGR